MTIPLLLTISRLTRVDYRFPPGVSMFCEQCGRANESGAGFCEGCGTALRPAAVTSPPPTAAQVVTSAVATPPPPPAPPTTADAASELEPVSSDDGGPSMFAYVALVVAGILAGVGIGVTARDLGALDFIRGERFDEAQVVSRENNARIEGRTAGERVGYDLGFSDGREEGLATGAEDGYAEGVKDGENRGYEGAGTSIRKVSWSYSIDGGDEGICVDFTGTYLISRWEWIFEFPDGTVDKITETSFSRSNSGWCYNTQSLSNYTDPNRLYDATLTVYVTRGSLTDRWGPSPSPFG